MNTTQALHFLLSIDESRFIRWHNECVIDPNGEYFFCTIRENNGEEIFQWAKETLDFEVFVNLCKCSKYSQEDKYMMFTDGSFFSFNSIEALLKIEFYRKGIVDAFLEYEDENIKYLLGL